MFYQGLLSKMQPGKRAEEKAPTRDGKNLAVGGQPAASVSF